MPGLLDFANTDDGMQGLGLLAAAAPQMAPQNLAGRLAQAAQGYQGMKDSLLKQQDLAQQLQIKNIALQQQQQEWAMQLPLLQGFAAKMAGHMAPQNAQQANQPAQSSDQNVSPTMPYSSPIDMTSGQQPPASQPTQQSQPQQGQPQPTQQPQSGGSMFPGVPDDVAYQAAAFGGIKSLIPLMTKYNEPTDLMKMMSAAGIDQNSMLGKQMLQQAIAKANYQAPTRLGEGAYASAEGGIQGLPTAAPKGFINVRGNDGTWSTQQVSGGLNAVESAGAAEARGPATMTPEKVFNDKNNKYEYQTKANIADAANGTQKVIPQGQVSNGNIRNFADINSINMAPPTQADLTAINAEINKPGRNAVQIKMLTDERNRIASSLSGSPQPAQQPQATQAASSGAYAAEPSLGSTANADAAQKASAQTMHDTYEKLSTANSAAPAALDALTELEKLAKDKNPLLAGLIGTFPTSINASAARYEKLRANLIMQFAKQNGTNGSDAGRELTADSVPDYGKPKDAQLSGLGDIRNIITTNQLKTNFLTPHLQSGDAKTFVDMNNQFDQNIKPSMAPILSMPSSPDRTKALKSIKGGPLESNYNWAVKNGLLK